MNLIGSIEKLQGVEFHDAVLGDIALSVANQSCVVKLELYKASSSQERVDAELSLMGAAACFIRLDLVALAEEAWAGNIQNCRLDLRQNKVRLYLSGGLFECSPSSVSMMDCLQERAIDKAQSRSGGIDTFGSLAELEFDRCVFDGMGISPRAGTSVLHLRMFETPEAATRINAALHLEGVSSILTSLDMFNLSSYSQFGNVQTCHVEVQRKMIRLYLADGLIEVAARSLQLVKS